MHELCGGQRTLVSARDRGAGLADVGEGGMEGMKKKGNLLLWLGASC